MKHPPLYRGLPFLIQEVLGASSCPRRSAMTLVEVSVVVALSSVVMVATLPQRPSFSAGDSEVVSIDYQDLLDAGELLTGTPTVVEPTTTGLTLGNKAVNTTELRILGRNVAVGEAVQFTVSGQTANTLYRIRVTVSTDATTPRTFVRDVLLKCVE